MTIIQQPSGWYLPKSDTYFPQFMAGRAPKHNGFMRDHLLEAFKYVRHWRVAVDVGAHVGFWCWDMAHRFENVYAFEATPCNYECLVKNVGELGNVHLHHMAVGDRAGACKICDDHSRPGNTGSFYIRPDPYGDVPVVALNQMKLPGCDLLKIDVEGFEWNVLRGASKVIRAHRPVIIMECSDTKFRERYRIPVGEAQRWLIKHGYREVADMRPDKIFVTNAT